MTYSTATDIQYDLKLRISESRRQKAYLQHLPIPLAVLEGDSVRAVLA